MQPFQLFDQLIPPPLIQPALKDALLDTEPKPLEYLIHLTPLRIGGDIIHHSVISDRFHILHFIRVVVEYPDIARYRRTVLQALCLAMQGMGYLEIEPHRACAGEDDFVSLARKLLGLLYVRV